MFSRSVSLVAALAIAATLAAESLEQPRTSLSDVCRDRIRAAAHYATAETHFHRGELSRALSGYQRAWRWDPSQAESLSKIAPLALSLDRPAEAVRYSLLDAETADAPLLRRLALYQSERQDWHSALRLYRLWLERSPAGGSQKERLVRLLTQIEIGRLEYLTDRTMDASRTFEAVGEVLSSQSADREFAAQARRILGASLSVTWEIAGRCHLETHPKLPGRLPLARNAFWQLSKSPNDSPRADYWLAKTLAAEGQAFEAYQRLNLWFEAGDDSLESAPYDLLQELLIQLNDRDNFKDDLQRLATPQRPFAEAALASLLVSENNPSGYERLKKLLLRDPALPSAICELAAKELLSHYCQTAQPEEIAELLEPMGSRFESFDFLADTLNVILADKEQARALEAMLKQWNANVSKQARSPSTAEVGIVAWYARNTGDLELATRLHRKLLKRDPAAASGRALEWVIDLILEEQPRAAAEAIAWGIEHQIWPNESAAPHYYQSAAFAAADQYDAALEAARRAAELEPKSADIAARVPWVLQQAGREAQAIAAYETLIEKFNEDRASSVRETLRESRLTVAYQELQRGRTAAAVEWLEQVLDEFPEDPGACNDLAYLWAERGLHLRRAQRMARVASRAEPDSAAYRDTLGWVQFKQGEFEAALESISSALALLESAGELEDVEILGHLVATYEQLGRNAEAEATRQKIQKLQRAAEGN